MVDNNIGKNSNFKCSQVLSFIALNNAIILLLFDNLKVKCNTIPKIEQNIVEYNLNF